MATSPPRTRGRQPPPDGRRGAWAAPQPVPLVPTDTVVTVVAALVVGYSSYRLGRFVFVTGRWDIVRVNLTLLMVGRFPTRRAVAGRVGPSWPSPAAAVLVAGLVHRRQVRAGTAVPAVPIITRLTALAVRLWPSLLGVLLLLALCSTITAVVRRRSPSSAPPSPAGSSVARLRSAARGVVRVGRHRARRCACRAADADAAGWDDWGGFMLNLFLAVAGDRPVLPARRAAGARAPLDAAAHPDRLASPTSSCSAACRCSCCSCSGQLALGFFIPRGRPTRPRRPGDRRVHALHRRLHRRDRARRTAVAADGSGRGRQGARPVAPCGSRS